jgi:integrase
MNMLAAIVPAACFLAGCDTLTTSHGLRRTFIVSMAKADIPLPAIMRRTGHR